MATFHDRTIAPRVQTGLSRTGGVPCRVLTDAEVIALTADGPALPVPFVFRPAAPSADPRSPDELLAEIAREIDRQEGVLKSEQTPSGLPRFGDTPELPPEPLLSASVPRDVTRAHMCTTEDSGSVDRCSTSTVCPAAEQTSEPADVRHGGAGHQPAPIRSVDYPDAVGVVRSQPEDIGSAARTLHLRRQLAQAAEHGVALLAALDLPRLVTPDFVPLDRDVIGSAIDNAINLLDDLDGDPDREDEGDAEPSLGWTAHVNQTTFNVGGTTDAELDIADAEPSLASPERHPEVPDWCAPIRYLIDQSQASWAQGARDDREGADEDGPIDEDELDGAGEVDREPSIGWPEDFTAEVTFTFSAEGDAEHDDVDREETAPERAGRGFVQCGPDDAEDGHDAETVSEDGSEDEPYPWRFDPVSSSVVAGASHV